MAPTQSTIGPLRMRWSSSACCTGRATSLRSPSAEDSPNDPPEGQRGQTSRRLLPSSGRMDLEHAGEIMHDVIVPEADHAVAATRDLQGCRLRLLPRVGCRRAQSRACERGRRNRRHKVRSDVAAESGARSEARARPATSPSRLPSQPAAVAEQSVFAASAPSDDASCSSRALPCSRCCRGSACRRGR